jgi:hypothetical protein
MYRTYGTYQYRILSEVNGGGTANRAEILTKTPPREMEIRRLKNCTMHAMPLTSLPSTTDALINQREVFPFSNP